MYLFETRCSGAGRRSSACWFTLQEAAAVGTGPGLIQELGTPSGSPMWVTRAQQLGPSPPAFLVAPQWQPPVK